MRVPFARFAIAVSLAAAFFASPGHAEDQKVSKELAKPLVAAQKAMKDNDLATALASVKEADAMPNLTDFDKFTIQEFYANIYIGQKDYANAAVAYEKMADSPALPAEKKKNVLTNAVLLDSNTNKIDNVKRYGTALEALGPLDSKVVGPLAVAYYNSGDTAKAQQLAQQELARAQAAGEPPQQGILDIVARTQLKSNDMAASSKTLETLVTNYGDPNDWAQLIDIAFGTKGIHDIEALHLYRLRVLTNAKTSVEDYATMAAVADQLNYPVEEVTFLEHGLSTNAITASDKAGAKLGAARPKAAKDKATIGEFEGIAKARKTGDYDLKLAETYYGYNRYADAADAAMRAMSKGGLKDPSEANMVLGEALAAQGKNAEAVDALSKANAGAWPAIAHLWTVYTQRKYTTATTR
ncbi:MAG: hypothetical protein JOZ72_12105 [Alphaproteobacteria bacterium]|nr:hypothetical protein [Alphaproteobacteria bacterium]